MDWLSWDIAADIEGEALSHTTPDNSPTAMERFARENSKGFTLRGEETARELAALARLHDSIRREVLMALEISRLRTENPTLEVAQAVEAVASAFAADRRVVARAFEYWPAAAPTRFPKLFEEYRAAIALRYHT